MCATGGTTLHPVRAAVSRALSFLLPAGYPSSVGPSYASYCVHSALASAFASCNGVLATQALLAAVGLGAGALPLAAGINWVLKDGLGQLGGVLFARWEWRPPPALLAVVTCLLVAHGLPELPRRCHAVVAAAVAVAATAAAATVNAPAAPPSLPNLPPLPPPATCTQPCARQVRLQPQVLALVFRCDARVAREFPT